MAQPPSSLGRSLLHSPVWRQNQPLLAITCLYMIAAFAASRAAGLEFQFQPGVYWGNAFKVTLYSGAVFLVMAFFYTILWVRPESPLTRMAQAIKGAVSDPHKLLNVAIAAVAIPTVESLYSSMKSMIPHLVPFYLDPPFAAFDRWLHFGTDPWHYTWALFGEPGATFAINLFYLLWFFVLWGFMFYSIFFQKDPRGRMRFLVAFALSWMVIGSFAATVFSSAGPVYFGRITGLEDPFAPLMQNLRDTHAYLLTHGDFQRLWALKIQERLWDYYSNGYQGLGSGISAFPSMHIATTAIMTFHSFRLNKAVFAFMALFLAAMLVGSVHLGWHYAIDGYVSIAAAFGLWVLAKKWTAPLFPPKNAEAGP